MKKQPGTNPFIVILLCLGLIGGILYLGVKSSHEKQKSQKEAPVAQRI